MLLDHTCGKPQAPSFSGMDPQRRGRDIRPELKLFDFRCLAPFIKKKPSHNRRARPPGATFDESDGAARRPYRVWIYSQPRPGGEHEGPSGQSSPELTDAIIESLLMRMRVTFGHIEAAAKRIAGQVVESPCPASIPLSEATGMRIFCKLEYLQR